MHEPYAHPDTIAFLKAVKKKYKPDKVVIGGDETDGHAISFHEHNPDLLSPGDELELAKQRLKPIFKLFPNADCLESNHGSLVYRKGVFHGIPRHVFKSYGEMLEAPKGWKWHADLTLKMSDGNLVYYCHGRQSNGLKLSQSMGMSTVQFHFHEKFEVQYWGNSIGLFWSVISGCMIDNDSLAFAYNKLNLKRPVIGCSIILNGHPKLLPMILKKNGRWNGVVP